MSPSNPVGSTVQPAFFQNTMSEVKKLVDQLEIKEKFSERSELIHTITPLAKALIEEVGRSNPKPQEMLALQLLLNRCSAASDKFTLEVDANNQAMADLASGQLN